MVVNAANSLKAAGVVQGALTILASLQLTTFKYPKQTCVFAGNTFDYIIVGGGTAGCVLASRLVEDRNITVLVIEAGGDSKIETEMGGLHIYAKNSEATWNFTIQDPGVAQEIQKRTNDDMSLGRALGGSSTVSFLHYTTGSKHDYNEWAEIVNDSIWNWDNVLPYFKKSQRLEDSEIIKTDGKFYGQKGNIGLIVDRNPETIKKDPYIKFFKEVGHNIVPSVNGNISLGYTDMIYTSSNSVRQSTAFGYLTPKINYTNLYILKHTYVKKIIFDANKKAIGVEAVICNNRHVIIKSRKEVIVSAGIVNTPKILMLSGIGPRKELCKHKIAVVSDLPVGEGFQNHVTVPVCYNMTKKVVPFRQFNPYKFPGTLIVGYVALNKSSDYPDYHTVLHLSIPDMGMRYCSFGFMFKDIYCNNYAETSVNSHMIFTAVSKQRFKSRGRILLKSNFYGDDPLIYTGYYTEEEDLDDHARILQDFHQLHISKTYKKLGGEIKDPKLPKCGKLVDSLKYWKCYAKYTRFSFHQYSSTCQMGSVLDSRLRVYGVKNLRVVDASIMPHGPVGGTLGPTIMIGEKAADIIKEDRLKKY